MVWLLIGYMFLFIHRPFEVWPLLGSIHLERLYMLGVLVVYCFILPTHGKWLSNRLHWAVGGFTCAVIMSWVISPWQEICDTTVESYLKILVFYILLVTCVHTERDLRRLILGFLVVMFGYMSHSLWEFEHGRFIWAMNTRRLVGVNLPSSDPNSFAATLDFALPLVLPFWSTWRPMRLRLLLVAYVGMTVTCVLLTGSRGAFVGLVLLAIMAVGVLRQRVQLFILGVIAAPLIWMVLPEQLQHRFETIVDPSAGPAGAQTSAEGRILGFWRGVALWEKYPISGCGPGAWREATRTDFESHNLYGQVMGELGTPGVVAFAAFLLSCWANIRAIPAASRGNPQKDRDWIHQFSTGMTLALTLMLVLGFFGHALFRYNWLWYGGFLVIARYCIDTRPRMQTTVGLHQPAALPWAYPPPAFAPDPASRHGLGSR